MIEVLWHGRGGQGAFTAAKLLGAAFALRDNESYALAFPSFGPERRGAPMRAFTKLGDRPIGNRSEIDKADIVIFLDDTLFNESSYDELKKDGIILLNTKKELEDKRVVAIDADKIAEEILKRPITNTVILGAFAAVTGEVSVENVAEAIKSTMPEKLHSKNIEAVRKAAEIILRRTSL